MDASNKKWLVFFVAALICLSPSAQADQPLLLKTSKTLSTLAAVATAGKAGLVKNESVLGKVGLFRGVMVDNNQLAIPAKIRFNEDLNESSADEWPTVGAVYGGLQVSLQEDLSLVYTPGRLFNQTLNGETQGLYLVSKQNGLANWYMGIESSEYASTADSRKPMNTVQFGVIMKLD